MKILQVNKYYFEKGGSERYLFLLSQELESLGHHVIPFAMKDERNVSTPYSEFFVNHLDFDRLSWIEYLHQCGRPFHSVESAKKFRKLLRAIRPDVAHLHNLSFHITSSILPVLRKEKIPFVMTLHDYALLAPNFTLNCDRRPCPHLQPRKRLQWKTIIHRCYDHSFIKSAIGALEPVIFRSRYLGASRWIAPSQFLANTFIRFGWPEDQIKVLPPFVHRESIANTFDRPIDILFVGRLTKEKGIETVVEIQGLLDPAMRIVIVGSGPMGNAVRRSLNTKNVQFIPHLPYAKLTEFYRSAKILLFPSLWAENAPFALLEAMSNGCVPVASNIGGVPEIVRDQRDGLLFEAGNARQAGLLIKELMKKPERLSSLRQSAIERIQTVFEPRRHLSSLLEIYQNAIHQNHKRETI